MADPRTRPYPPPTRPTASPSSRERAFNDIFSTGRPAPSHHPPQNAYPNGNGAPGLGPQSHVTNTMKPGYTDGRNHMATPRAVLPPQQTQYEDVARRSPPSRAYGPSDVPGLRTHGPSRPQPYDPRMTGQRQVSAPHPPQQRMYSDVPPPNQRYRQDYPSPGGSEYRTKSLSNYNRPHPPTHRANPSQPQYPAQDGYSSHQSRMATAADGRVVPERPYDRSFTMSGGPLRDQPQSRPQGDRSYSLTSAQRDQQYPTTRPLNLQQRRIEDGRSMTISGRMGTNGLPQMDFSRPVAPRQQIAPGSPRRQPYGVASSRTGAANLTDVHEEVADSNIAETSPQAHPSVTSLATSSRHESVDSTSSDIDSAMPGPQRTKSSSSFPTASPTSTTRRPSLPKPPSSQTSLSRPARAPIVYPALLSRVAIALREKIVLGDKQKDGLTYPNAFTGSEAVDLIAYVIKTSDRNLALLLGRALDAQRWFHDVTYVHRYLRFSPG